MPLYEYQCPHCGRFEIIQKFSDPVLSACPTCGQEVQKLLSAPAIQFKGTGWYITDYARKGSAASKSDSGSSDGGKASETSSSQNTTSKDSPASGGGSSKSS